MVKSKYTKVNGLNVYCLGLGNTGKFKYHHVFDQIPRYRYCRLIFLERLILDATDTRPVKNSTEFLLPALNCAG